MHHPSPPAACPPRHDVDDHALLHLDLPHKPPPLSPARGPPQSDLLVELLDQTPAFDPDDLDP